MWTACGVVFFPRWLLEERVTTLPCILCGKPVGLQECKVNDFGQPLHEACLMQQLKEEERKRRVITAFRHDRSSSSMK